MINLVKFYLSFRLPSHKSTVTSFFKTFRPAAMPLTSEEFERLADDIFTRRSAKLRLRMRNRRFRSGLGISSHVCSWYWNRLEEERLLPTGFQPKHFIWTLLFMKLYCAESVNAAICGCDEKTFRKWSWLGMQAIGELELVSTLGICKN